MKLPVSQAEFLAVFTAYKLAIWPLQLIAAAMGLFAMGLLYCRPSWADRAISGVLATFWLAMGIAYHVSFFSAVNRATYAFAMLFLIAAALFLVEGVIRDKIRFDDRSAIRLWPAIAMLGYGFLFYPLWGLAVANPYPETPL